MRNFSMLALEERIVLDATLTSPFLTTTINVGEAVDLSGGGWLFRIEEAGPGLVPSTAELKIDGGSPLASANSTLPLPPFSVDGVTITYDYRIDFSGVNSVQFNTVGVHDVFIDFVDPDTPDLKVATITVIGETTPPVVNQTFDFSGNEGTTLTHQLLARVTEANSLTVGWFYSSSDPGVVISNFTKAPIDGTDQWNVYGDITIKDRVNSTHTIGVQDNAGNTALFEVKVTGLDAPITEIDLPQINTVEGSVLTHLEVARFNNANSFGDPTLVATVTGPSLVLTGSPIIEYNASGGYYSVFVDAQLRNVVNGSITINLRDLHDGTNLSFVTPLVTTDAPFTIGSPLSILVNPGALFNGKVGSFIDGNRFESLGNYSASIINWGDGSSSAATLVALGNGAYDVYGSHTYAANPAGLPASFVIQDGVEGSHQGAINLISNVPPFEVQPVASLAGVEGGSANNVLLANITPNSLNPIDFDSITFASDNPNIVLSNVHLELVSTGSGDFYQMRGDVAYIDNGNAEFTISVGITTGYQATFTVDASAINAPLTPIVLGPLPATVEGQFLNDVLVAQFTDANPNSVASDFTANVDIAGNIDSIPYGFGTDIRIVKGSDGVYSVFADITVPNEVRSYRVSTFVTDVPDSATGSAGSRTFSASDALLSVGSPLDIAANQGVLFSGKIGSFIDNNPNELASNYNGSTINWGDGTSSAATLVSLGNGAYDVYGTHTFASNPNGLVGTFTIRDGSLEGTENGSFNIHSVVQQLLWGVDENTGKLFSVSDYSQAGAANRVTVYGQLHTAAGVIIGSGIDAFTIDATDANGKNAAYFAVSKAVGGINTFSIGVIADINDLAHNTEVKLYTISGMSFNMAKDAITGLAVDPITGNLMGVVVRGDSASSSLFVIDKNSLQSTNQVAKAYNLGAMVGSDDSGTQLGQAINQLLGLFGVNDLIGGMKIANARDMAFDNAGRLFVTDGNKDILYQINVGNGEIIGIANAREANGLPSNPNIEALAWDPIAGKLVGASSVGNLSDLIGLSVTGGANTLDVDNLVNLQDVQGMAFKPQFAHHGGADLGILIDFSNTDLEYRAGDRAVLLLQNVDLIDFGGNSYSGGSLNVDVSDNANSLTDMLAVSNNADIKVTGSEVRYKGLLIGMIDTIENGKNGKDLTFHFNANATEKAVEALMNRITYMNTASSLVLGNKMVAFTITDSLGSIIGYTTVDLEIERRYF